MSITSSVTEACVLDAAALDRALRRMAHEIVERHEHLGEVVIAGIRNGGVPLAAALVRSIDAIAGNHDVELAAIDVVGYRDDAPRAMARLRGTWAALSRIDGASAPLTAPAIDSRTVVLVDDVIQTGRTLRAALDAVTAHGRAAQVESAVLIDRGRRELPVRVTYVGKNVPAASGQWVDVRSDGAYLVQTP